MALVYMNNGFVRTKTYGADAVHFHLVTSNRRLAEASLVSCH